MSKVVKQDRRSRSFNTFSPFTCSLLLTRLPIAQAFHPVLSFPFFLSFSLFLYFIPFFLLPQSFHSSLSSFLFSLPFFCIPSVFFYSLFSLFILFLSLSFTYSPLLFPLLTSPSPSLHPLTIKPPFSQTSFLPSFLLFDPFL